MKLELITSHLLSQVKAPDLAENPVGRIPVKEGKNLPASVTEDVSGFSLMPEYSLVQLREIRRRKIDSSTRGTSTKSAKKRMDRGSQMVEYKKLQSPSYRTFEGVLSHKNPKCEECGRHCYQLYSGGNKETVTELFQCRNCNILYTLPNKKRCVFTEEIILTKAEETS